MSTTFSKSTDSPAFLNWFGISHAVDAQKEPLKLYHGSGADTGNVFHAGTFFSARPDVAGIYAAAPTRQTPNAGPNIAQVYLSIQRPYVFDDSLINDNLSHHVLGRRGTVAQVITKLAADGYDSLILKNYHDLGGVQDQYVVFCSSQIKSAIGNNGDFDATNPDIRFSMPDVNEIEDDSENDTEAPCP